MRNFHIKICGITTVADALAARDLGADAIGLNFYAKSLRGIAVEEARKISIAVGDSVEKVGVFVNATPDFIKTVVREAGLDAAQLHGDESPDFARSLSGLPLIRAIRFDSPDRVQAEVNEWTRVSVSAVLLDAAVAGHYGGSGTAFEWQQVKQIQHSVPIVLAGGLNPANVANAICTAEPDAVDVASGVECFPGGKDKQLLRQFIEAANQAFGESKSP